MALFRLQIQLSFAKAQEKWRETSLTHWGSIWLNLLDLCRNLSSRCFKPSYQQRTSIDIVTVLAYITYLLKNWVQCMVMLHRIWYQCNSVVTLQIISYYQCWSVINIKRIVNYGIFLRLANYAVSSLFIWVSNRDCFKSLPWWTTHNYFMFW